MFDRIGAGQNRATHGLRGVGVNRNWFPCLVRFVDSGFELLESVCWSAAGPATQGAEYLDHVDIGRYLFTHKFPHGRFAFRRLDSGFSQRFAGHEQPRPGDQARIDGIAKIDVNEIRGAQASQRRESTFEVLSRVVRGPECGN